MIVKIRNRKSKLTILMLMISIVCLGLLIGCSTMNEVVDKARVKKEKTEESEEKSEQLANENKVRNNDETVEEEVEEEAMEIDEENKPSDIQRDDIYIGGKIIVEEDKFRVEGESNLVEGTTVSVKMYSTPFTLRKVFKNWQKSTVEKNGTFEAELELSSDFWRVYSGSEVEVELVVSMTSMFSQPIGYEEVYGEYGENFTGPSVYEYEVFDDLYQQIYVPTYILVGDEVKEYDIETPKRERLPDDYGETDIWIDTKITNDHRYYYIHGKSNLLQGTEIKGAYYEHPDAILTQGSLTRTLVEPDGTFLLRIDYKSLTDEGVIKVFSRPGIEVHEPKQKILKTYGEQYEKMSGEYVVDYEDGGQQIEIIFEPETLGVEVPENTAITEADGELKVQVPDDVLFDLDKSDLKSEAQEVLNEVIEILESLEKETSIEINGHTDNQGEEDYNLELSEKRATAVEKYITENGDVQHLDISMKGYGMTKPIASNEDEDGRQRNRRVEIVINR